MRTRIIICTIERKHRCNMANAKNLVLPVAILLFQAAFLAVFGTFVEYNERGSPDIDTAAILNETGSEEVDFFLHLESSRSITQTYPLFQDVHVMIFIGFGFLMTFLRRYGYGSVGFNMFLAAFAIQWSTITSGVIGYIDQVQDSFESFKIKVGLENLVGSDFAAAAVLITMGAVLGRASPFQLIIIAFFEIMFYSANEALNIHVLQAADIGGSMLIHTFGAYFGMAVSCMLYNKKASDHPRNSTVYHSDLFAMIGTLFLWVFWPSFNSALTSGNAKNRAIINTYYAMTGSVMSTFIFSVMFDSNKKITMTHIQNATLAGGVAVGAIADMVLQPWGATFVGFSAGLISVVGYKCLSPTMGRWFYLQDTCGVHNLHGMPGVFAGFISAVLAGIAEESGGTNKAAYGNSLYLVFPARAPSNEEELTAEQLLLGIEPGDGRHAGTQAGFQLALLTTTVLISIIGGLLTGLAVRRPLFLTMAPEHFFDDDAFWNLPDNANMYLPPEKDSEKLEDSALVTPLTKLPPEDGDEPQRSIDQQEEEEERDIGSDTSSEGAQEEVKVQAEVH